MSASQVHNPKPIEPRMDLPRDPAYRKYVVTFQEENPLGPWGLCAACGTPHHLEAAHTGPTPGRGLKASDYTCIPLCNRCHRTDEDSYHNRLISESLWMAQRRIDLPALIDKLLEGWL